MAKAPAKKAAVKAPAKKGGAPAKNAAAKAPAKTAAAKAPATPNVTPERPHVTPDVEAAAERIKKTSERVLELSKQNGLIWLEAYEKMLDGVLKLEEDRQRSQFRLGRKICVNASRLYSCHVTGVPRSIQRSTEVVPVPFTGPRRSMFRTAPENSSG